MATWFSGTDTATLREEGNKRNHFVSLIVNNEGKYTAGITRKVKSVKQVVDTYTYESFEDKTMQGKTTYSVEDERIEWFELNIEKKGDFCSFRELDERINEIRKEKEKISRETKVIEGVKREEPFQIKQKGVIEQAPLIVPPTNTYPTLFDDDILDYEDFPFDNYNGCCIDESIVDLQVARLVTGAIGVSTDKFNIEKYVQNTMVKTFDKAFGDNVDLFNAWADMLCEFVVYYPIEEYKNMDEDLYAEIIAVQITDRLKKLPTNKYIENLIKTLERWTMMK